MNEIQTEQKLVHIKGIVSAYWNTATEDLWDAIIEDQQLESYTDEAQIAYLTVPKAEGMQMEATEQD